MTKFLSFVLIAGYLGFSTCAYVTMQDFRELILPKCYDRKDDKELINGQVSPIPSSLETFVSIVERLEERFNMEKIVRSFIARFRFDDVLLRYVESSDGDNLEYITRGDFAAKKAHEILQDMLGGVNYEMRDFDLSDDEQCALYFMISHTVNDSITPYMKPEEMGETVTLNKRLALKHPREQGVVNLNGKTLHAFALGKVLLGILAGLQDSERTIDAETIFKSRNAQGTNGVPEYLKSLQINVLHGVTMSDIIAVTLKNLRDAGTLNSEDIFLPNGYWDDSVCPTKYILNDNNDCYVTTSLFRGAIDGLFLGKKIKSLREMNSDIKLSQVLRMYYNPRITSTDSSLSDVSWCNRHSFFSSVREEIIDQATTYYQLYTTLFEQSGDKRDNLRSQISHVVSQFGSRTPAVFDDVSSESEECGGGYGSKICETPRSLAVVLDTKFNREIQDQIIGNLSVGFHMSPSSSFMAVFPNAKSVDKLPLINISDISGCASCASKYYGIYDSGMSYSTGTEEEVLRALNRTLSPDGLPDDSSSEPGVPSKVVIYFNYGNPQNKYELQQAIKDFRYHHRGTKFLALGSKREALRPFVENVDDDIFTQDVTSLVKPLKEKVCKVPAQFQYENCYKNSRSDEDSHSFQGFITPNHVQYWAMFPKYFLKSFKIRLTFTTVSGQIKVCFTRHYDEMYGTGQSRMRCATADGDKAAIFDESNPCKKYSVESCRPFYFSIEAMNVPEKKCSGKNCRSPNQIEFEFKHSGISCNRGISFAATPMTLAVAIFISIYFIFKH